MKKTTGRKTVASTKKRSSTKTTTRRKATSASSITKRKMKPVTAAATKSKRMAKKILAKSSRALAVRPAASDTALQMGRAVGTILGKAIGNVERAVSRVMKNSKTATKKRRG